VDAAVNRIELRKQRAKALVRNALRIIEDTQSQLGSIENGQSKKCKQKPR